MAKPKTTPVATFLPFVLLIGGLIGLTAAFLLTVENMKFLEDPSYVPTCSLNPVLSCGPVMQTDQGEVFGFSNSLIGIATMSALSVIGAALLAGAKFKRWFWLGLQTGVTLGMAFTLWLMYQSIYELGSLCPYCMVTWVVMIPIFWYTTVYNLEAKHLRPPKSLTGVSNFILKYRHELLITFFVILIALILNRFWYYWSTLV